MLYKKINVTFKFQQINFSDQEGLPTQIARYLVFVVFTAHRFIICLKHYMLLQSSRMHAYNSTI